LPLTTDKQCILLDFDNWLHKSFPYASTQSLSDIKEKKYPYPSDRYNNTVERIAAVISGNYWLLVRANGFIDGIINCNVLYLSNAFGDATYNYRFAPSSPTGADVGFHSTDLCLTFSPNMQIKIPVIYQDNICNLGWYDNPTQAEYFQQYLISFVIHGDPNTGKANSTPSFNTSGAEGWYVELTGSGFTLKNADPDLPVDPYVDFWQPAPYE